MYIYIYIDWELDEDCMDFSWELYEAVPFLSDYWTRITWIDYEVIASPWYEYTLNETLV